MILPLLKGLWLTLRRLFSKPITVQYPEEKRTPAPRWRGMHCFRADDEGNTTCVACGLCVAICPSKCIYLEIGEREDGQRYPVNAIKLGQGFEYVKYKRSDFDLDTEKLLAMYKEKEKE